MARNNLPDYLIDKTDARFDGVFRKWFYEIMKRMDSTTELYGFENFLESFEMMLSANHPDRVATVTRDLLEIEKIFMKTPTLQVVAAYGCSWINLDQLRAISTAFLHKNHAKNMQIRHISAYHLTVLLDPALIDYQIPHLNLMAVSSTVTKKAIVSAIEQQ